MSPKIPILGWFVAAWDTYKAQKAYLTCLKTRGPSDCEKEYQETWEPFNRSCEACMWTILFLGIISIILIILM